MTVSNPPAPHPDELLSSYSYDLPEERIAQVPAVPRDSARLLVVDRQTHAHRIFRDLPELLQPGDLLVLNDTRVIPARLFGRKITGPHPLAVEVLLLEPRMRIAGWPWSNRDGGLNPVPRLSLGPRNSPVCWRR